MTINKSAMYLKNRVCTQELDISNTYFTQHVENLDLVKLNVTSIEYRHLLFLCQFIISRTSSRMHRCPIISSVSLLAGTLLIILMIQFRICLGVGSPQIFVVLILVVRVVRIVIVPLKIRGTIHLLNPTTQQHLLNFHKTTQVP